MFVLSAENVESIVANIDYEDLVQLMRVVFETLSTSASIGDFEGGQGEDVASPPRTIIQSHKQTTLFMPSRLAVAGGSGIKVVSVPRQGASADGLPATTLLLDDDTGRVNAIVNATQLTALRNAAGSALATRLAGISSPTRIVLFGAGLQVLHHARIFLRLYPTLESCTIVNRSFNARLNNLGDRLRIEFPSKTIICGLLSDAAFVQNVLSRADVVCTATPSTSPLFETSWLNRTAHINLIGSYTPHMREVHDDLIAAASLILVDSIRACSAEAGELIHIPKDRLVEVGTLSCSEKSQGRNTGNSVAIPRESYTVFKSVGVGAQDVAIAAFVVECGKEFGFGNVVSY